MRRVRESLNRLVRSRDSAIRLNQSRIKRDAWRVQRGIDDAEPVVLGQEGLLVDDASLQIVDAFDIGNAGPRAGVRQETKLRNRLPLKARRTEISESVVAGVVVVLIVADEDTGRNDTVGADQARPGGRDVVSPDLRALIRGADRQAVGADAIVADAH